MSNDQNYQSLFQAACKLIDDRLNLDGRPLSTPGFFERRRLVKALRLLAQAAEVEPPYGAASLFAAKVADRLGDREGNISWLRRAQVTAPDNAIVSLELGGALSKHGLHTEAIEVLSKATKLNPDDPRLWSNLGLPLLISGKTQEAIAAFERLVVLEPEYAMNKRLLNFANEVMQGRKPQPKSEAEIVRNI